MKVIVLTCTQHMCSYVHCTQHMYSYVHWLFGMYYQTYLVILDFVSGLFLGG